MPTQLSHNLLCDCPDLPCADVPDVEKRRGGINLINADTASLSESTEDILSEVLEAMDYVRCCLTQNSNSVYRPNAFLGEEG